MVNINSDANLFDNYDGIYTPKSVGCFDDDMYPNAPEGYVFADEIVTRLADWIGYLRTAINDAESGADVDAGQEDPFHQKAHDIHETYVQVRVAQGLILKHNLGVIDLSSSMWVAENQIVGEIILNIRKQDNLEAKIGGSDEFAAAIRNLLNAMPGLREQAEKDPEVSHIVKNIYRNQEKNQDEG